MAHDWASKSRLERDIQAVAEGRSDTLDLGRSAHYGVPRELPAAIRQLPGLRTLRLTGSGVTELPTWLIDIGLRRIDARGCSLRNLLPLPWVEWALDAGAIRSLGTAVDPGRVYGTAIGPDDDPAVVEHLFRLVADHRLALTELVVGAPRGAEPGRPWPHLAAVDQHLDRLIAESPGLRELRIADCPLERVPESVRVLRHLTTLQLSAMQLGAVPGWVFEMPGLTSLNLSRNHLTGLPPETGRADGLAGLDLSGNPIREIPDEVWQLSSLATLDLRRCPIQRIPAGILRLHALTALEVDDSRSEIVVPPPEVTARGLEAIKSFWMQEQASGLDRLAEAKLLIVGEAGAGKTTLAKKILDPGYRLNPDEGSTQGIAVLAWRFPSAVRVAEADGERMLHREFRVNTWDFGGQEIYHSTHQFFLTRRSVYVLVTDARKEDTDFHYWLEIVNLLSDGSPLIIVQNRKQGRAWELDVRALRREYPNLVATLTVDLADNTGLADAVGLIRRQLESLQHIGTALPRTWQGVRIALEEDVREYITEAEFFRICAHHGFTREADMRQLGGFLHDLGICLYFQEDPVLRQTIVLKPEWGTGAVYRILDDPQIVGRKGVFGTTDLDRIWHEPIYEPVRDQLVRLMAKFSLCFPVRGTDQYVAPQLLSKVRPGYPWDEPDGLALRYDYDVMPQGIIRRLIVELHDLIEGDAVWYSGVVFTHGAGRAEVTEDYRRRRLHIRLAGKGSRVMLTLIVRALDLIHLTYPDLRVERFRPCACETCAGAAEPGLFSVQELETFARAGDRIQCRVSRRMVDPAVLLNELWQPDEPAGARPPAGPGEVFVSYKWGAEVDALVDEMQGKLASRGVTVIRDREEIGYRAPIQQFMRRLGAGAAVILIIDEGYLRSQYCMFELTEIADRPDFAEAIFPVVLPGADIYDPIGRISYIRYWEERKAALEESMRTVGQENLHSIRDDLDLYEKIRNTVARITEVLRDMNTLTVARHTGTDFTELYQALDERLAE